MGKRQNLWKTIREANVTVKKLDGGILQGIAKIIGDMFTRSALSKLLVEAHIENKSQESTKWRMLDDCFITKQNQDNCANNILNFVQIAFSPTHNLDNPHYERNRLEINQYLGFCGFAIRPDGKIISVEKSVTISDAKKRAIHLKNKLRERNTHHDIFTYCGSEIESENYFHVVFEATKGVFDKIRSRTGLKSDGAELVAEALSFEQSKPVPYLALNSLSTKSEQSEQKGFMNLLIGIYGMFRNPAGHEVKIKWDIKEEDALDILSLISLVNRRIDNATEAKKAMGQ